MDEILPHGAFYGQAESRREFGDLTLVESCFIARASSDAHAHESAFFYLVLEGECQETLGPGRRSFWPASLVFHPSHQPHANYWPDGGRCLHIEFGSDRMGRLKEEFPILNRPADFGDGLPVWLATRLYKELRHPDSLSPLVAEGVALELLAAASRSPAKQTSAPFWLRAAKTLIRERFTENLGLSEIAAEVGVDASHLSKVFRGSEGCTIGEYIRKLRVDSCCRQMLSTNRCLADIGAEAGFADQSHFTRTFRAQVGLTPTAFRETHR